jgi:hypothetical protein
MRAPMNLDWLARQFADVGEAFPADVSAVHISLVADVHFGALELEVHVFGRPHEQDLPKVLGASSLPVVAERIDNLDDVLDVSAVLDGKPVPTTVVSRLFADDIWNALAALGERVTVLWNPGCETPEATTIDPQRLGQCPELWPMAW